MDRDDESIYLLDMSLCEPSSAISTEFARGRWTLVDYSIAAGAGRMLFCGPDTQAPPLRLRLLEVEGWYHIFIGTYRHLIYSDCCLLLKLRSDPAFSRATTEDFRPAKDLVPPEMLPGPADLCEAYWKSADLKDEDLIFHRPLAGSMAETITNIAYVRLVPLSAEEQARAEEDRQQRDTRRLIANYDGGQHHLWSYASYGEMADEFQALAGSDVNIVLWGVARSFAAFYPSRVGSEVQWTFGLPGVMRTARQATDRRRRHGFDPLETAVQCAHEVGVEIYPQVRMSGEQFPPNHRHYGGPGAFQVEHPEFRCRTPEGYTTRHLSQAFPEVRAKYVELFREWVEEYPADGVCIVFCRSWPYVLYEKPVIESFRTQYGVDMRELDFFDPRVLAHRASFLTQLLRETRQMLDEVGDGRNQHLGTCYVVPAVGYTPTGCPDLGPFTTPRSRAMDVETWVTEGLVDHLVVHIESVGEPNGSDSKTILQPYVELARGTRTRVYADLYPRRQSADSMRVRAMACYESGVDGLCFWDSQKRALRLSGWAMHRLLGHREELPQMKEFADGLFRLEPMLTFDGYMVQNEFCVPTDG